MAMLSLLFVTLLHVGQSDTTTFLSFSRRIETCDDYDHPLEETTTKVIWSYNHQDPVDDKPIQHENRGTKSVRFFSSSDQNPPKLPTDAENFEIKQNQSKIIFDVPWLDNGTQYWCSAYKIELKEKRQIIRIEPIIEAANLDVVHHMLAYFCDPLNDTDLAYRGGCYEPTTPPAIQNCNSKRLLSAWAVGGTPFDLPEVAGLPVTGTLYILVETHYNNQQHREVIDSSGMRYWHTGIFRKYDAGIADVGHSVDNTYTIPPQQTAYRTDAWCDSRCTASELPEAGINVSAIMLHTHIAGREIYFRQYRNGTELPLLQQERYYDFNYQDWSILPRERVIQRGDLLKVECVYNTIGRDNATLMGLSSLQEMCLAYFLYYPKTNFTECQYMNQTVNEPTKSAVTYCRHTGADGQLQDVYNFTLPANLTTYVPPVCNYIGPPVNNSKDLKVINSLNTSAYENVVSLADNYQLYWTIDKENGVYNAAVAVKTTGWVGLGLSASGGMANSDVLIGWVKDGVVYFADRFAKQQGIIPASDQYQDYYNIAGGEITNTTTEITNTTTAPESSKKDLVNRPTKIGVSVAGSVIGVLLIIGITYLCLRRRKKEKVIVVGGATLIPPRTSTITSPATATTSASGGGGGGGGSDGNEHEPLKESEFSTK